MHRLAGSSVLLLATALAGVSCSSNNQSGPTADGGGMSCADGMLLIDGNCVAATSAWTQIKQAAPRPACAGDPYSFFVHLGTTNKLLVYFAFGGFCYNASCARLAR